MNSLRFRLLAGILGVLTLAGVLAGIAGYVLDRKEVDEALDGQLRQIALNVGITPSPATAREGDGVPIDPEDRFVVTIWGPDGAQHSSDPAFQTDRPDREGYANFSVRGEDWRAYARQDGERTVQVAQRVVVRDEFAASSALRATLPIVALIPVSWLLIGWVIARTLRPLQTVTGELRRWGDGGSSRLSLEGLPDEILPLARTTNALVLRLQGQIEFRERFISDAAHELRTPLTALRLQARNLRQTASSAEQKVVVQEMSDGIARMADMVSKLLQLARADASTALRSPTPVDLSAAVTESLQDAVVIAAEKQIDIGVTAAEAGRVWADAGELRTLLTNLVENAVRYTPAGGVVDLSVARRDGDLVFEVRDTGPGIPESLHDRVFHRFFRIPGSESTGSGLGLPIVKAVAERCGARITLDNRSDRRGLVVRVAFASAGA